MALGYAISLLEVVRLSLASMSGIWKTPPDLQVLRSPFHGCDIAVVPNADEGLVWPFVTRIHNANLFIIAGLRPAAESFRWRVHCLVRMEHASGHS